MSKLTVSIPDDLHQKIREELEKQGITTSQFIEQAVINFFENPKGEPNMATRTLAFQVSEELFQRVKAYLARYEEIHHRKLSQKEFVISLIEAELDEADEEFADEKPITLPPRLIIADSKESLVRVLGSKNSVARILWAHTS